MSSSPGPDLNMPDQSMDKANKMSPRLTFAIVSSIVLSVGVSMMVSLGTSNYLHLGWPLGITMALGPLSVAIWLWFEHQSDQAGKAVLVAIAFGFGSWFMARIAAYSLISYNLYKLSGLLPYLLLIGAVIAYAMVNHRLLSKPTAIPWLVTLVALSLLAPWFWVATATYCSYNHC